MFIIIGLGNPGKEYDNTRHNAGYRTLDQLAAKEQIVIGEKGHKALLGKGVIEGEKVLLVKPLTYMNASGECVRSLVDYYKVDAKEQILVISDDISLPLGEIRLRKKGSAGGHNGLKNIILHLGHCEFQRIKIGVGEKPQNYDLVDYVLGHFSKEEQGLMDQTCEAAATAVKAVIKDGMEAAMNRFNGKGNV